MSSFAQSEIRRLELDIAFFQDRIGVFEEILQNPTATPLQIRQAQRNLEQTRDRIVTLQSELATAQQNQLAPVASSADTTGAAQTARDDGASPSNPVPPQQVETPDGRIVEKTTAGPTNADPPPTAETGDVDSGTNAATITYNNSQATSSPPAAGPLPSPPSSTFLDPAQRAEFNQLQGSGAVPGATPVNNAKQGGVGARSDDAAGVTAPQRFVIDWMNCMAVPPMPLWHKTMY